MRAINQIHPGNPGRRAAAILACLSAAVGAAPIFTENFNGYTGNQNNTQANTGLPVAFSGNVTGWSKSGAGTMHAVKLSASPLNWAIMFYQDNVITLTTGIAANTLGVTYKVEFDYGTGDYAGGQATSAADSLLVEVVRAAGTTLASNTFAAGAWSNPTNVNLSAGLHGTLTYVGDGSGAVRLRIGPTAPFNTNRFEGEIDNLSVSAVSPTLASSAIVDDKSGGPVATGTLVTYTVTFSKDMDASTVTAADFGNAGTAAVTIGTVTETSPTSGVFTVQATPTSVGTLQLKVNAGAVLNDAGGIPLDTTSAIVDDTTLVVFIPGDTTPPTLTSIADDKSGGPVERNALVTYTVTFDESMNPSTISAADFGNAGSAAVTIGTVTQTSAAVFSVPVTPTTTGTLQLRINAGAVLTDLAGNALVTNLAIPDDTTLTVNDTIAPTLTSIVDDKSGAATTPNTPVTYTVTFNEDMDSGTVSAADFGNAGTAAVTIGTVSETTPGVFTVQATPTSGGTLRLQVNQSAVLKDVAGNSLVTTSAILDDTTITVDATPPAVATINPADNATGVVPSANLVVTFTEAIAIGTGNITVRNLTDNSQTTIAITDGTQVSVSGAVLTINPTANLAMLKNYAIRIDATAIKDLSGNFFAGITDDTTWNFTTTRILADARGDFRTPAAGGSTADFNGGTGLSDTEGSGRWNYLNGEASTLLTFGVAGNAGQSMYQTTGQTNGLPALGDRQIFSNVSAPAAGKIQWHVGATTAKTAVMRWTASADVTNLTITGDIAHGIALGTVKFDILVNEVNQFTATLSSTIPSSFNVTGLSISAGQHVKFILSDNGDGNGGDIADLQTTISGDLGVITAPVVENQSAMNIAASTATLRAIVTSTGFQSPNVKIYYGPSDGGTTVANWSNVADLGTLGGAGSSNVSGLSPVTTYYFRAFAQNSGGSDWADATGAFTTQAVTSSALEIVPIADVTGYTALLNGRVTSTGNDTPVITIVWGASDAGTTVGAWANSASLGAQPGAFGHFATNLQPATTYYFRAVAVNAAGTTWTNALTFATNAKPPIVINEIHYKPADRTKAIEFIELHNPSTTVFDLSGWRLLGGVDFVFPVGSSIPAGGYRVLAGNTAAFQAYYGFAPYGQWLGTLKNTGETLELRDGANVKVDDVDFAAGFPWPTSAAGRGPSIELIHPGLENDLGGAWRSSTNVPLPQTPGAANSVFAALAPPAVRDVNHTPNAPVAGQSVLITARISDANGVASATLQYQTVDPGAYIRRTDAAFATSWTSLLMNDAGADGDTLAGDGVFSATISGAVQTHRRLVRYRISAGDTLGTAVTVPYADDEQPNFAYFIYNGVPGWSGAIQPGAAGARGTVQSYPPSLLATFEPWHLIANTTDVENSQYNSAFNDVRFLATLVYDGKVYDHIQFKNRGKVSTYVTGKNKWALFFNRARDIRVKDNWGYYYEPWNSLGLDANASPWCAVHRGATGVEEAVSYRMFELGGMPALRTNYVHWRVIDGAVESGPTQYEGDMWGLYMAIEPMEGNYLDERGLPDGNVYNIEGTQGDKTHQGATQSTDASDWNAFRDGANAAGQTEAWYRANIDLPALYTFFALGRLNGNVDVRAGDNFRFYHRPTDNRWVIAPYDLDMMFVCGDGWGANIDGVTYAGVTSQFRAITRHPQIALEFRNRARELLDLLASDGTTSGGQIGQLIDEYAQLVAPTATTLNWAALDAAMWNLNPRTPASTDPLINHKNNFFRTPYNDRRGGLGGTVVTNWTRTLSDPDSDGYSDFAGLTTWFRNYATNTWPGATWARNNGNQNGYGYKYLEWESLYGGLGANPATPDLSFPNTPVITYTGPVGFPANALDFSSSGFSPSASGGTTFAAMQWRIGEIYAPGIAGYTAGDSRKYEVEDVWTSAEIPSFTATVRVPVSAAKPGSTYRARVRHKDANGRWSHWSAPVPFTVGTPNISVYLQSLVITEVNYNPAPASSAEITAGFGSDDFEWIEVKNIGAAPLDMTGVRFTKGVDFDFPAAYTLPGGGFALVVKNVAAFRMRYGTGFNAIIAGSFPADNFSNSGEEVKLSYGAGTEIRRFTYDDAAPWPVEPDGTGSTLVLIAPHTLPDHALATNWRASLSSGGSPGADDGSVYSSWKTANGITEDADDRDGDGLAALLEYALGNDPSVNDLVNLPIVTRAADGTQTILVTRAIAADDVTFIIETSNDLSGWIPAGVTLQSTASTGGRQSLTYILAPDMPPESKRFLRVNYTVR